MSSFLIDLWSTEKSYTVPFKKFCSVHLAKSCDTLPKQTLYELMLSFALNVSVFYIHQELSSRL